MSGCLGICLLGVAILFSLNFVQEEVVKQGRGLTLVESHLYVSDIMKTF